MTWTATTSHYAAAPIALGSLRGLCLDRHGADLFEGQLKELPRHGRTFHVLVDPHLLGHAVAIMWINDVVWMGFGSKVSLETQDGKRQGALGGEGRADLVDPLLGKASVSGYEAGSRRNVRWKDTNERSEVVETWAVANIVAYEDQVWFKELPALWAGCVIEL